MGVTPEEARAIATLGPWPPPLPRDPGNRVSGRPLAIELGRQLFRDPRMSPVGYIACVTCHQPDRAFTDLKPRAHGVADLPRNTPALANLSLQRWYGWGGGADSLWMAGIKPILDSREFDGNGALVVRLFAREPELAACYRRVFGVSPLIDPERTVVNVGKALAAFVETLVTARTPFDEFRDALLRGDARAAAYPPDALRGLRLFVGRGGCIACHSGPNFSDGGFHAGVAPADVIIAVAIARSLHDNGRLRDARDLLASRFNLRGAHNDDASRRNAAATRRLTLGTEMAGRFRTPSLRNVAVTAPYFHDGRTDLLAEAARHAGAPAAEPLRIGEADDLAAFLSTLTDAHGARRPWDPAGLTRCR
ncbi:MAG TPA: cytochrome c peroxidase [Burkholderiaceae bacterium]|nr:cytochrome c peroxidase [Burkholderiaceae bacterium]